MQPEIQQLLLSDNPLNREEGLKNISERVLSNQNPSERDITGLSSLLFTIYERDPNAGVRCTAISNAVCPSKAIARALFDAEPQLRTVALRRIGSKNPTSGDTSGLFSQIQALISIESEENVLLEAIRALQRLIQDEEQPITANQIFAILGHHEASGHGMEHVFNRMEAFGIICDIAEHDSPAIRSAVTKPLGALLLRAWRIAKEEETPSSFDAEVTLICFSIVEELVQDTNVAVQMTAVHALNSLQVLESEHRRRPTARKLSEKSAKCLLRLLEPLIADSTTCGDNAMLILAALKFYPFATLSAYGLVETFLCRRLYSARAARIQRQGMSTEHASDQSGNTAGESSQLVATLETTLREVVQQNRDFARVFDLNRSLSDKTGNREG